VVLKTVEEELSRPISEVRDRVYFDTGEPFSRQEAADLRTTSRDIVENLSLSALDEKGNPDVPRKIQAYLNDLPPHGFSQARKKYIAKAYEAVASMPSATEREKRSQSNALMMLRHIDEAPKPLYEVRRNTHRLFAPGSLQGLNRNIRAILTQDWINLDLKSAHLAICARLWGVDSLQDFLSSGESIWDVLIDHMEGALQKQAIKEILYALTYGAGVYWTAYGKQKPRLLKIFEQWGLSAKEAKKARKKFLKQPLVSDIYETRKEKVKKIKKIGEIEDCFGVKMRLKGAGGDKKSSAKSSGVIECDSPLTLLSAEVAAIEMMILWPAFDLLIGKEKRCKIMIYTYDGIYIRASDKRRSKLWVNRIAEAVNNQARCLKIPTRLVLED
jgi:hypothetical protein